MTTQLWVWWRWTWFFKCWPKLCPYSRQPHLFSKSASHQFHNIRCTLWPRLHEPKNTLQCHGPVTRVRGRCAPLLVHASTRGLPHPCPSCGPCSNQSIRAKYWISLGAVAWPHSQPPIWIQVSLPTESWICQIHRSAGIWLLGSIAGGTRLPLGSSICWWQDFVIATTQPNCCSLTWRTWGLGVFLCHDVCFQLCPSYWCFVD